MPTPPDVKEWTPAKILSMRHKQPLSPFDYRINPYPYPALKTEQGVFTTEPYTGAIKPFWRFKDEEAAKKSVEKIWEKYEKFKKREEFIGMDTARKFIQMGRTRSLRYALRKGGKKYDQKTGKAMARTGKVYDQGKLDGANVFEVYLKRCWDDEVYSKAYERWKKGEREVFYSDEKEEKEETEESGSDIEEHAKGSQVKNESAEKEVNSAKPEQDTK